MPSIYGVLSLGRCNHKEKAVVSDTARERKEGNCNFTDAMAEGSDREIQVRTLTGESVNLSISTSKTVQELKLLLNQTFPPAANSPNFHLFFKGQKLRLQLPIYSYRIGSHEFLVLIPFAKKDASQTDKFDHSNNASKASSSVPDIASVSNLADSTWSDIMGDISCLREVDATNDGSSANLKSSSFNAENGNGITSDTALAKLKMGSDCEKQKGLPYHHILNTLEYPCEGALSEHNCEVFVKVLEAVNCLSDLRQGYCKLFREACFQGGKMRPKMNDGGSCLCPTWLKMVLKAFAFLNIFSAFLHLQNKNTTLIVLEEALHQLNRLGSKLTVQDMENLSLLCPKIICFTNNDTEKGSFDNVLVVIKSSTKEKDQFEESPSIAHKRLFVSKIVSNLKRRETSFRTNLWQAFEDVLVMSKIENEMAIDFCMEDLLASAKSQSSFENKNKSKRARRISAASTSNLDCSMCHDTKSLFAVEMVEHLQKGIGSQGQMVHIEDLCGRKATLVQIPVGLSENMRSALRCIGVSKLYSHQATSIEASLSGRNVVVATMTSSGKSLCYNLPVLEVLSKSLLSCALYIFPTKALAQDQLRALFTMTKEFDVSLEIGIYDGDTSQEERVYLRDKARLLITNPDMLHISILSCHKQFQRILSNLRFVVIDETHTYKGAFGCHTALILRRLRRLCSHVYGTAPSFVFSTATSANPREHCMELANLSTLELIQNDGSPSARKLFILWNPTLHPKSFSKESKGDIKGANDHLDQNANFRRSSPIIDLSRIFAEMVQHGLRCIAFCKSRKLCELVLCYTREILQETAPHLVDSICSYRGGYIAEERRKIESDFFGGKLSGIAATNALELGIDVGEIDATLHLGFPGSIASLWQQAGRGGRRDRPSLAVYVAFGGPLDQYFMNNPKQLFERPIECCHVDAQNKQVLEQHLICAAHEHPLSLQYDEKYFGSGLSDAVMVLNARGFLSSDASSDSSARMWKYIGPEKWPSHSVNIRAIESVRYQIMDELRNQVLEEIEESKAFFQIYEGAVYIRQGKSYLVKKLDLSNQIALCKEAELKYYTKTRDYSDIHVIGGNMAYPVTGCNKFPRRNAQAHVCKVTTTWFGFYRIWRGSNQIFDAVDLSLPPYSYESQAVWIPVPQSIKDAVMNQNFDFRGGLHAASHAVLNVVPLSIICNLSDLAPECPNPHDTRYYPERILLYDQCPGGAGISMQIQPVFMKLLEAALELLRSCYCSLDVGCPNCIQSFACHEYNEVLHKDAAIMIIKGVLDAEN